MDDESAIVVEEEEEEFNLKFLELAITSRLDETQSSIWKSKPPPPKLNYPAIDTEPGYVDFVHDCILDLISSPHSTKSKVSKALWIPEACIAKIISIAGNQLNSIGHFCAGSIYLLPEETLYLVDNRSLLLFANSSECPDDPFSVEQWYNMIINGDLHALNKFLAFRYLKRLGFIVNRSGYGFNGLPEEVKTLAGISDSIQVISNQSEVPPPQTSPQVLNESLENKQSEHYELRSDLPKVRTSRGTTLMNELQADFDVYRPCSQFSKKRCGIPDYKLHVAQWNEMCDIQHLIVAYSHKIADSKSSNSRQSLFAVVKDGLVSFLRTHC